MSEIGTASNEIYLFASFEDFPQYETGAKAAC